MGRWSRPLAPGFIAFAGVSSGDRVLDVGTGTGALASALLEDKSLTGVTGIDPSEAYVNFATEQYPDARAAFEVGDAQAMRFEDDSYDRCLSLLVLNFIPDPMKAVVEMRRVTKPGGVIAAAVWDYSDGMQMLRVFWDEAVALDPSADARDEGHMPYCRKEQLEELWQQAGMLEVEVEALSIEQNFASFDDYWNPFLLGTGPAGAYVASLDAEQREVLRERIRSRLVADGGDGSIVLEARVWAVRGVSP
jgi:SAM-dependent methyltransferase